MTRRASRTLKRQVGRPDTVAGIDLGSNSFHMLVARTEADGRVMVLDRLRDPVRLAAGLDEWRELTPEAMQRALATLERFGERLRDTPSSAIRAVGTNTLRQVRNGAEVEERFSEALGHPIEIISGREEARLIYLGVSHGAPDASGRQLVLDIGGGSTELILGEGFEPILLDSLYMGCVSYTQRFFPKGRMTREGFRKAGLAAGLELSSIRERYREIGWEDATGSSGTILAVEEVMRQNGWSAPDGGITGPGLEKLEGALIDRKRIDDLALPGLEAGRAPVFAGGVAILKAAFHSLGIDAMGLSNGALREGLVYELLGLEQSDLRDRTIEALATRYNVDRSQAERVAATAAALFEQANESWGYDPETALRLLGWAARVHEIGLSIAYSGFHKHGAYLLEHAEMPGFSLDEQAMLAAIVGNHRRKLSRRPFAGLTGERRKLAFHLTILLRIAVRLHHSRSAEALPEVALRATKSKLRLAFPEGWLAERPLSQADLAEEADTLRRAAIDVTFSD